MLLISLHLQYHCHCFELFAAVLCYFYMLYLTHIERNRCLINVKNIENPTTPLTCICYEHYRDF